MDGTFHAIATILHRVPRESAEQRAKRRGATRAEGEAALRDIGEGWIRVAL